MHVVELMQTSWAFRGTLAAHPEFHDDLLIATARVPRDLGIVEHGCWQCNQNTPEPSQATRRVIWMPYINEDEARFCYKCGRARDWDILADDGSTWKGDQCGHKMWAMEHFTKTQQFHRYTCGIVQTWSNEYPDHGCGWD